MWLLLLPLDRLTTHQVLMRQRLLEGTPEIQQAVEERTAFRELLHVRDTTGLEPWLSMAEAARCRRSALLQLVCGETNRRCRRLLTTSGVVDEVEGLITKIKLVKRQMFGRGSLDLLKQRVMAAS